MSAIGDYVHLHGVLYNMYGINQSGQSPSISAIDAYNTEHDNIEGRMEVNRSKMTIGDKEALKKQLAYLFSTDDSDKELLAYQDVVRQKMQDSFSATKIGDIDWNTGDVAMTKLQEEKAEVLSKIAIGERTKEIHINAIKNDWDAMQKYIPEIQNLQLISKEDYEQKEKNINSYLDKIANEAHVAVDQLADIDYTVSIGSSKEDDKLVRSVVSDINNLINIIGATPPINLEKGSLFEYALDVAQAMALGKGLEEIKHSVGVVGGNRTSVTLDTKFFTQFDTKTAGITNKDQYGTTITVGTSQDKVDVNLTLGSTDAQRKNQIAAVSAKSRKGGSSIDVLTESSLLYLLQDEDANFVNHYLNLAAAHEDNGQYTQNAENFMLIQEQVKDVIIWKALSGDTYGKSNNIADTFIINDNTKTGEDSFQIYSIPELAQKVMDKLDKMASITVNRKVGFDNIQFANDRASSYTERISHLLGNVNAQKISVALKPAAFRA